MSLYQTTKKNFDERIVYYLEEIKTEEIRRDKRYDFVNYVLDRGLVHCFTDEQKNFEDFIFISLVSCSKEIENKLEELTKN